LIILNLLKLCSAVYVQQWSASFR